MICTATASPPLLRSLRAKQDRTIHQPAGVAHLHLTTDHRRAHRRHRPDRSHDCRAGKSTARLLGRAGMSIRTAACVIRPAAVNLRPTKGAHPFNEASLVTYEPVSGRSRTSLRPTTTDIENCRPETCAQNSPLRDLNSLTARPGMPPGCGGGRRPEKRVTTYRIFPRR
jgi:hypothetical protein